MRVYGDTIPAADPVVVTEYGQPMKGRYLATRRRDGALYVRISLANGPTRKWVRPSKVEFQSGQHEVFIDKYTDLRRANV